MMEEQVPSFPIYVTLPVWGVVLLFVLVRVWRLRESCATFLLLATWFRYSIATFHLIHVSTRRTGPLGYRADIDRCRCGRLSRGWWS